MNTTMSDAVGQPYEVTTNALGFRGRDDAIIRPEPSTLRVAVFGDSFVFGIGAPQGDTIPELLERLLQERLPGRKIEVMNFGLPANYTLSHLRTYEEYGRQFLPDAVIFCQPRASPEDINTRIYEIRNSPFLSSLMSSPKGRWLVNYYQTQIPTLFTAAGNRELEERLGHLAGDMKEHEVDAWFYQFFEDTPDWARSFSDIAQLLPMMPESLRSRIVRSGFNRSQYRESAYIIPGDGHPNAEGRRYFAQQMAELLLPGLQREAELRHQKAPSAP